MSNKNREANLFFQSKPCLSSHVFAMMNNPESYINELAFLCSSGTVEVVSAGVKARILAALHIMSKHKTVSFFLDYCEATDIAKAFKLLDRPRRIHQLSRKIRKIESEHPHTIQRSEDESTYKNMDTKRASGQKTYNPTDKKQKNKKKRRRVDVYRRDLKVAKAELNEDDHSDALCADAHADTAVKELIDSTSVSGALARKVRQWAKKNLKSDFLEFVLLALPGGPWANLADFVHFSPQDFSVPYFLEDVCTTTNMMRKENQTDIIPADSFVSRTREMVKLLNAGNLEMSEEIETYYFTLAEEFPQIYHCYSYIRTLPELMKNPKIVQDLARNIPIDALIWYFEEIISVPKVSKSIVVDRIKNTNNLSSRQVKAKATYGKLVERILTARRMNLPEISNGIIPLATEQLNELKSKWNKKNDTKVAVFGDASSSMQCAIEAASIFASMASVCFDGELSFFHSQLVKSPHERPKTVGDTLEICDRIRARGCTSLAAALWPYCKKKKFMDMFVLVTDEGENIRYNRFLFAELLSKYKAEVNKDVKLVVVCVGSGNKLFRDSLQNNSIDYRVVHIDSSRPDLAKFGAILGQLAMMTSRFEICSENQNVDELDLEINDMVIEEKEEESQEEEFVLV